jgi:outer membrane protein TolC
MKPYRQCLAAIFMLIASVVLTAPRAPAQQAPAAPAAPRAQNLDTNFGNTRWFPDLWGPYLSPYVPEAKMSNSELLHSLLSDGKLHLSISDLIELALENNLDIAVARYNIAFAHTDILRSQGGGATRGFTGSYQSSALFSGAIGSSVSAGGAGVSSGAGGISGGASATPLGGGSFDPSAFFSFGWDRNTTPLGTTVVTGVPFETNQGTSYFGGIQQAFQTGTSYEVVLGGQRGSNTSLTPVYNPSVQTIMAVGFTQPLLNGYGRRANSAQIRIAKNNLKVADSVFRQQVITTLGTVLNDYWDYVADQENVHAKEEALAYTQKQLEDNKKQVEIGTLAPIEVVRAESELATNQQALIVAQTTLQQQAELIKTALTRQVGPELASAQLVAEDKLPQPRQDDVPSLDEALKRAFANRPEIEQAELNSRSSEVTIAHDRNGLLPSFNIFGTYIASGLYGDQVICPAGSSLYLPNCVMPNGTALAPSGIASGGVSQALTQTLQGRYPNYAFGANLSIPIRNRQAQGDMARALLERRQLDTQLQQSKNNIASAVRSAIIGVIQAKAQINAAEKATTLERQTLEAEQKKFKLGESTVFLVIQVQRDLATAEGNEITARSTYAKAITSYQQAVGTILSDYNLELNDAIQGAVSHPPNIPGSAATPIPAKEQQ